MRRTLLEVNPLLAAQWSEKNKDLTPSDVTGGSNRKVWWHGPCGHEWQANIKNRVHGAGCPYCAGNRCLPGFNDLSSQRKKIAREWSEKNLPLTAKDVTVHANRVVWWKCRTCGQEWRARVSDRSDGSGCPYCAGAKREMGVNDLESRYPDLMLDWSDKNYRHDPGFLSPLSRENVWWKCHECGYEWKSVIAKRVRGQKCPLCAGRILIEGYNDVLTNAPEFAEEWHPFKNDRATPENTKMSSKRNLWWRGKCGHSWQAALSARLAGSGCPVCEEEYRKEKPRRDMLAFAKQQGIRVLQDDDSAIGLSFDLWFPELYAAADFPELHPGTKKEYLKMTIKKTLCVKAGIQMVRTCDELLELIKEKQVNHDSCTQEPEGRAKC